MEKSTREIASAVEPVWKDSDVSGERLRQGDAPNVGSSSRQVCESPFMEIDGREIVRLIK